MSVRRISTSGCVVCIKCYRCVPCRSLDTFCDTSFIECFTEFVTCTSDKHIFSRKSEFWVHQILRETCPFYFEWVKNSREVIFNQVQENRTCFWEEGRVFKVISILYYNISTRTTTYCTSKCYRNSTCCVVYSWRCWSWKCCTNKNTTTIIGCYLFTVKEYWYLERNEWIISKCSSPCCTSVRRSKCFLFKCRRITTFTVVFINYIAFCCTTSSWTISCFQLVKAIFHWWHTPNIKYILCNWVCISNTRNFYNICRQHKSHCSASLHCFFHLTFCHRFDSLFLENILCNCRISTSLNFRVLKEQNKIFSLFSILLEHLVKFTFSECETLWFWIFFLQFKDFILSFWEFFIVNWTSFIFAHSHNFSETHSFHLLFHRLRFLVYFTRKNY